MGIAMVLLLNVSHLSHIRFLFVWLLLCWIWSLLPHCRDDHGFSPLHWACREGRSSVVDMLIMRGARINVMNRGDDAPLHLASSHGHRDIVGKVVFMYTFDQIHDDTANDLNILYLFMLIGSFCLLHVMRTWGLMLYRTHISIWCQSCDTAETHLTSDQNVVVSL